MLTNVYKGQTTGWYEFDKIIYGNANEDLDPKDEVMLGRYILLCYCDTAFTEDDKKDIEDSGGSGLTDDRLDYWNNYVTDGKISKDRMIYKKVYNNGLRYIEIGRINEIVKIEGAGGGGNNYEYNADNVYFSEDIIVTTPIGTITQDTIDQGNGSAILEAEGKSISQVFSTLLSEAKDPVVDTPSVSFIVNGGSGEVGTSYTLPTATLKVTDVGSYTYGSKDANNVKYDASDTGVVFAIDDMSVTFGDNTKKNNSALTTNGSISITATDTETLYTDSVKKYKFSATAKYTESDRVPLNNLGNKVESKKITTASILIDDKEVSFTGWRKMFMGTITDASATITSDIIRGLTLVKEQVSKSAKTFTVPVGATKIIVAFPKSYTSKVPKFEYFTMSWEDFSGFEATNSVKVADARGGENGLKDYTVYTFTHSSPSGFEAATQYRVTLQ